MKISGCLGKLKNNEKAGKMSVEVSGVWSRLSAWLCVGWLCDDDGDGDGNRESALKSAQHRPSVFPGKQAWLVARVPE